MKIKESYKRCHVPKEFTFLAIIVISIIIFWVAIMPIVGLRFYSVSDDLAQAMAPTLKNGDGLITKIDNTGFDSVSAGDIVVLHSENGPVISRVTDTKVNSTEGEHFERIFMTKVDNSSYADYYGGWNVPKTEEDYIGKVVYITPRNYNYLINPLAMIVIASVLVVGFYLYNRRRRKVERISTDTQNKLENSVKNIESPIVP